MRVSEIYTSVQGEGPNVGKMIQFIRFGGCNYRCPGWPCDTPYAIFPEHKAEWRVSTPDDIMEDLNAYPRHVCLTGGEPLIQRSMELDDLVFRLRDTDFDIDLFTNGSQPFPTWVSMTRVNVVMDWKLQGSGEGDKDLEVRNTNRLMLREKDAVKFVVSSPADLLEADQLVKLWRSSLEGVPHQIYVGAVWGKIPDTDIITFMKFHHLYWTLNVQVHKHIWTPTLRGV